MSHITEKSERTFTPAIILLFFLSGCAALIYEVIWLHLLSLTIGASAISLGVLLASFMGGMFLGSLFFSRVIPAKFHPLRVYAILELGISICGALLPHLIVLAREIYVGYGSHSVLFRAAVSSACLIPPTLLMGATLPAIARWISATPRGISRLGFFYGSNIAGAVAGALLAGFVLLPEYDVITVTYLACGINLLVAAIALILSSTSPYQKPLPDQTLETVPSGAGLIYIAIALSGLTALGAQVVWNRLISIMFGATTYCFSIILGVFLTGLGIGSSIASFLIRRGHNPRYLLGWCQLLLVTEIVHAGYMIARVIPGWGLESYESIHALHLNHVICCAASIIPATILWGASFPLAVAAGSHAGCDTGRVTGNMYAANTTGAIAGALLVSLAGIPLLGTYMCHRIFIILAALSAVLVFISADHNDGKQANPFRALALPALVAAAGFFLIPPVPYVTMAYGQESTESRACGSFPFVREGVSSTVAVQKRPEGIHYLHISGKVVASNESFDMRIQRMLGHLPAVIHSKPRSVLVVGLGAGVTSGCFAAWPDIERIVICEIEPSVHEAAEKYFAKENHDILNDPRVEVIFDDARHFLSTTKEKFDIITSDPIHPWVRGAAVLFSQEYYRIIKTRLNSGGVVAQWVPLYETSEEAVRIQVNTFSSEFPECTVWNSDDRNIGYDVVMIGQMEPTRIDVAKTQRMIDNNPLLQESLADVSMDSAVRLFSTYASRGPDMKTWLQGAELNRDMSLKLEYASGLSLIYHEEEQIYSAMTRDRKYPEDLFIADEKTKKTLKEAIFTSLPGSNTSDIDR